jgi:uroporphyrinogen III methyltransferase/synthase
MTQEEINEILVQKAKESKIICRLKGGDPFIFGRGGEEAEVLAKHGIEFEVVPGVSSSVAAPAYAGIPLTHRLYSSSFAVIPGYEDTTKKESSIDWSKLSTSVDTLVFLMAVNNINMVTQKLIENGRSPDTPVAVIRWGTRPEQRTITGTLKNIVELVKEKDIKPPAVMVVGDVVRLRESLSWYEKKPMFGHRILVTRGHSEGFEPLEELGAEIIEFPTIEIVPPESYHELDKAIDNIETYDCLIFTSKNGVQYFLQRFFEKERDIRDLKGINICAVGSKTAKEIQKYGIKVDLIPDEFSSEGLIKLVEEFKGSSAQGLRGIRFLLPRAEKAREVFPEKVRELGGHIDLPVAYRSIKPELHGKRLRRFLREGRISIATFTSAATYNNFMEIMGEKANELLQGVAIAVIGPVTAKAVEKAGLKVDIMPREATIEALVEEIIIWAMKRGKELIQ